MTACGMELVQQSLCDRGNALKSEACSHETSLHLINRITDLKDAIFMQGTQKERADQIIIN